MATTHTYAAGGNAANIIAASLIIARVAKKGRHAALNAPIVVGVGKARKAAAVNARARVVFTSLGVLRLLGPDGEGPATASGADGVGLIAIITAAEQGQPQPQAEAHGEKLAARAGFASYAALWSALKAQGGVTGNRAVREVIGFAAPSSSDGGAGASGQQK